jgi:hypothetical protein
MVTLTESAMIATCDDSNMTENYFKNSKIALAMQCVDGKLLKYDYCIFIKIHARW